MKRGQINSVVDWPFYREHGVKDATRKSQTSPLTSRARELASNIKTPKENGIVHFPFMFEQTRVRISFRTSNICRNMERLGAMTILNPETCSKYDLKYSLSRTNNKMASSVF